MIINLLLQQANLNHEEKSFLHKLGKTLEINYMKNGFNASRMAEEMAMCRMSLHRKVTPLFKRSANELLRTYRLYKAAEFLKSQDGNILQACYDVGFNHPSYFARKFKEQFGKLPSHYVSEVREAGSRKAA